MKEHLRIQRVKEYRRLHHIEVCKSKMFFPSRKAAWYYALVSKEKYGTDLGVYRCFVCHKFHLSRTGSKDLPK